MRIFGHFWPFFSALLQQWHTWRNLWLFVFIDHSFLTMSTTAHEISVGLALANACADKLEQGGKLCYSHRDYCGIGLHFADGKFIYCEVFDGEMPSQSQYAQWQQHGPVGAFTAFAERGAFVEWLAAQTDTSLSGRELADTFLHDNQRLTLARLREFCRLPG